jgi:predicted RND superfamily exporter protein
MQAGRKLQRSLIVVCRQLGDFACVGHLHNGIALVRRLSCLVLGIGTEFTILIMERFREEEAKGLGAKEAIKVSLSKVGQAITASGLTVVVGFSTLIFVSFPVLRDFGLTTVIDTSLSLICSLTILPALIVLFRKRKKA